MVDVREMPAMDVPEPQATIVSEPQAMSGLSHQAEGLQGLAERGELDQIVGRGSGITPEIVQEANLSEEVVADVLSDIAITPPAVPERSEMDAGKVWTDIESALFWACEIESRSQSL